MKMTLTTSYAADLLKQDENANWSYAGAYALIEYLEQLEDDTGDDIEFCRVSLRCDFSEYASLREWHENYFGKGFAYEDTVNAPDDADDDAVDEAIREYINDNGTLIEFDGGIIVSSF